MKELKLVELFKTFQDVEDYIRMSEILCKRFKHDYSIGYSLIESGEESEIMYKVTITVWRKSIKEK